MLQCRRWLCYENYFKACIKNCGYFDFLIVYDYGMLLVVMIEKGELI